jgi:hypothetical protein
MGEFIEYWKTLKPMAQHIIGICMLFMVGVWTIVIRMMNLLDNDNSESDDETN